MASLSVEIRLKIKKKGFGRKIFLGISIEWIALTKFDLMSIVSIKNELRRNNFVEKLIRFVVLLNF